MARAAENNNKEVLWRVFLPRPLLSADDAKCSATIEEEVDESTPQLLLDGALWPYIIHHGKSDDNSCIIFRMG